MGEGSVLAIMCKISAEISSVFFAEYFRHVYAMLHLEGVHSRIAPPPGSASGGDVVDGAGVLCICVGVCNCACLFVCLLVSPTCIF